VTSLCDNADLFAPHGSQAAVPSENFEPEVEACCARTRSPTVLRMRMRRVYLHQQPRLHKRRPTQGSMSKLLVWPASLIRRTALKRMPQGLCLFVCIYSIRPPPAPIHFIRRRLASACEWRRKHFPPLSQQRQTLLITLC
jgi:hypothetical protein